MEIILLTEFLSYQFAMPFKRWRHVMIAYISMLEIYTLILIICNVCLKGRSHDTQMRYNILSWFPA